MINPEPGKFYKTHSGEKAHVLGRRDDGSEYPFIGYIVGGQRLAWRADGSYELCPNKPNSFDLVEEWVEPVERTLWVNVYADVTAAHPTRERADWVQCPNRLARVKVTCTEGQFDE